jgi:hypothetical protein
VLERYSTQYSMQYTILWGSFVLWCLYVRRRFIRKETYKRWFNNLVKKDNKSYTNGMMGVPYRGN